MEPAPQQGSDESFHNLMGRWLSEPQPPHLKLNDSVAAFLNLADLDKQQRDVHELLERAQRAHYPKNQWVEAHGLTLQAYLARPMQEIRGTLSKCLESAHSADLTIHPAIPPFDPNKKLETQADSREDLADRLEQIINNTFADTRTYWATQPERAIEDMAERLKDLQPYRTALSTAPRDPELSLLIKNGPAPLQVLAPQIAILASYIQVSSRWYAFLAFIKKSAAASILSNRSRLVPGAGSPDRYRGATCSSHARLYKAWSRPWALVDEG